MDSLKDKISKPPDSVTSYNHKYQVDDPHKKPTFPIVGIGASAGGLEAFVQLLNHLDVKTGMAFVLVQHLDPSHQSLLSEILARATTMPVTEVTDGMSIEPDHVYVMPPNTRITVSSNALRLSPRRASGGDSHHPIDEFFRSLAQERKENAIGVVLSGTATDGADGTVAITAEGGVSFAQDRKSAKFDGMPAATIANGVDFILTPSEIGATLNDLARSSRYQGSEEQSANKRAGRVDETIDTQPILALLRHARGTDFNYYKRPTVVRRILRRMTMHKLESIDAYVAYLKQYPAEIESLYEDILVKVTCFFRNPESFQALHEKALLPLLKALKPDMPFRVWVPGCATGEDAYSVAICLLEAIDEAGVRPKIELFASDISEVALSRARLGRYDLSITEHVSPERLARFFILEGHSYRVVPAVRDCCVFAKQNVTCDPPFSNLNLISCRNLLIYLAAGTQKHVLAAFHFALNADGILALGSAETVGDADSFFTVVDKNAKIYVKKPSLSRSMRPDFVMGSLERAKEPVLTSSKVPLQMTPQVEVKSDADRAILRFMPPSVVVDERFNIRQFRGDTSKFLLQPSGEPTTDLFKLCRSGLLVELRSAIHEASASGEPVKKDSWYMAADHKSIAVTIDVIPFPDLASKQRYFVIMFFEHSTTGSNHHERSIETSDSIRRLEHELAETKDYLNAIILKEQGTNEELKSASEEILSANEELQSTNEEIATAKEETQAANEELITVNDELHSRNQELTLLNDDLANIFESAQIPLVMLSSNLSIRRLTPMAEKVLNLSKEDIGQSLRNLGSQLRVDGIAKFANEVLETLNTKVQEIQDCDGRWYSLRIKPYRTTDNKIDGTVVALFDIDHLKRNFDQLKEACDYADSIIQTTPIPLLILDSNLKVVTSNKAFYSHFHLDEGGTTGVKIYELENGRWNIPELRKILEEVLPKDSLIERFIFDHDFLKIGRRTIQLSARCLIEASDKANKVLVAFQDITAERQAEAEISVAMEVAETANQAKSDFLANMSHEIRTPLGAILGYSEILGNLDRTKDQVLHSASRIRKNVEQLTELINEILDIAKIESGKFDIESVRFSLLPELAEIAALLETRAEEKGLEFRVIFESLIPQSITTCPRRLRQILINIGGNALKFTDHGGVTMTVSFVPATEGASAKLVFVVTDTGCGLSEEQSSRLFQPFIQADSSVTRRYGGTGLGLILARRLAEALGGDVVLTWSQVDKGSTFKVTIDTGSLEGVKMLAGLNQDQLKKHKETIVDWFTANQRLADVRVLLVEDGPDNQLLLTHFLSASGAVIEVAGDGKEGIKKANEARFDIVLMDIQMPTLDGYEATKRLRAAGFDKPIIALTAHAMQGEREKCLQVGCTDYISKPVKPNELIELVENLVKKKRLNSK